VAEEKSPIHQEILCRRLLLRVAFSGLYGAGKSALFMANSSLSSRFSFSAAQLTFTKVRLLWGWKSESHEQLIPCRCLIAAYEHGCITACNLMYLVIHLAHGLELAYYISGRNLSSSS